jgi:hypothetical protein
MVTVQESPTPPKLWNWGTLLVAIQPPHKFLKILKKIIKPIKTKGSNLATTPDCICYTMLLRFYFIVPNLLR